MFQNPENVLYFSAVSLWEVAIKAGLGRADFTVDAGLLRRGLLDNGYEEVAITGDHTTRLAVLPPIHKDPFDRMLIVQAIAENLLLSTVDETVARYPAPCGCFDRRCLTNDGLTAVNWKLLFWRCRRLPNPLWPRLRLPSEYCGFPLAPEGEFHKIDYAIRIYSSHLVMRQLGQLEMRQFSPF